MYIGCLCTWVYCVLYEQLHVVISTHACVLPGQRGGHSWTPGAFRDFSNLLITQSSLWQRNAEKRLQDFLLIYFYIHPLFFQVVLFLVFLTYCFVACTLLIEICNISRYIFLFFVTVVVSALYGQKYWATYTVHLQEVLSHGNLCHEAPVAQFLRWC